MKRRLHIVDGELHMNLLSHVDEGSKCNTLKPGYIRPHLPGMVQIDSRDCNTSANPDSFCREDHMAMRAVSWSPRGRETDEVLLCC